MCPPMPKEITTEMVVFKLMQNKISTHKDQRISEICMTMEQYSKSIKSGQNQPYIAIHKLKHGCQRLK
uniref:Uncharacterized protein n=1 Tax=Romanomermis culicivorax TaxID=13658 RepID=A0A915KQQ2_ROMCU